MDDRGRHRGGVVHHAEALRDEKARGLDLDAFERSAPLHAGGETPGANRNRRGEQLNWAFIFKHIRIFLSELDKRKQVLIPNTTYRVALPQADASEPALANA